VVRAFCAAYSSFVRAVPVVTFMMLIYFGLPALGIALDPFRPRSSRLRLTPQRSRRDLAGGDRRLPARQLEAARAFGMTRNVSFWRIVFPQIWRSSLPSLVNEMTLLIR